MPATKATPHTLLLALVFAGAGAASLSGCASSAENGSAGIDARFGEVTAHNMEAQFVPPTEAQKANTYIRPNPARQRLAIETYEAGEVELAITTTE